jgi:hypothetical protein
MRIPDPPSRRHARIRPLSLRGEHDRRIVRAGGDVYLVFRIPPTLLLRR